MVKNIEIGLNLPLEYGFEVLSKSQFQVERKAQKNDRSSQLGAGAALGRAHHYT